MTASEDRRRMSEEAHFELSYAAMSHERHSRPRGILLAAAAAVVLAALFAGYGLKVRSDSQAELRKVAQNQAGVETLLAEWAQLEAMEHDPSRSRVSRRIDDLLTQMEGLARRAGLQTPRQPSVTSEPPRGGVTLRKYIYGSEAEPITSPTLGPLLEWLRLAEAEDLGMEVDALTLKPDANNWRMTVTFRRLERSN